MPESAAALATAPYVDMSPSLLSQQPVTPKTQMPNPLKGWGTMFAHLESRLGSLRSWRWSWWAYWAALARMFIPRRYIWLVVANRMWRGSPINDAIIDSTGQLAVRTCSAGMWTGLTSPSRPWFKFGIGLPWLNLADDAKDWLEDSEQRVYTVLQQSNFYNIMSQGFQDLTVFGTSPITIYEDFEDVCRFYIDCAGEFYLQVGSRLTVDTKYREFTLTVGQIVEQFREENCPPAVAKLWQEGGAGLDTEFVVCHAIEPNFPVQARGRDKGEVFLVPPEFVYREIYWLKGQKSDRPLSRRGFHEKPFIALRAYLTSNDAYGRSFCMDALGDTKQVQVETLRKAEFIEKGVRPPMGANPELKNEPMSITPGGVTFTSTDGARKGFWPLMEVKAEWVPALSQDIDKVNERINKCLFVDLFMAITRMEGVQPRNELELTKRDLERLQELGPVIDLVEGELSLLIQRVLKILQRRNMLKPVPPSLKGVPLRINYISIMRLAQKSAESIAMKDTFSTAGALSSAAKAAGVPDPIRTIDLDKALRHYAELNNFPSDCVFTLEEVEKHDQARQQAMAQAQAPQQAMAAVQAAKTLSDTQLPGGNSALGALTGQGAGT